MQWTPKILALACMAMAAPVTAQSAIEHHAWQDRALFEPVSRTAMAITGAIVLWGNPDFAEPGSMMRMTFEAGPSIDLVSVGASWREWDLGGGGKQTAEVFQVGGDPGQLLNGNTLCGDDVTYLAFFEGNLQGTRLLQLVAFSGEDTPVDVNSAGLCATFNYGIE